PSVSVQLRDEKLVSFGKGVLAQGSLVGSGYPTRCLVRGVSAERCQFLRVAPWTKPPTDMGYFGPIPESIVGAWSAPLPAETAWTSLSPGREVVYGVRGDEGLIIDVINEKGEARKLVELGVRDIASTRVLELPTQLAVLGVDAGDLEMRVIGLKSEGGQPEATSDKGMGLHMLPPNANAAWAREVIKRTGKVGYGAWTAAPSLNAKGEPEDAFYLAWTQVIPPAKYTPAGVAPRKRGAKNGCGMPSRPLFDVSVEKKVHVSRYSLAGKRLDDRVLPDVTFAADDTELALHLVPTSYGYVLNGRPRGRDGALKKDAPAELPPGDGLARSPGIPAVPSQSIETAVYDQTRGEGLVMIGEEKRVFFQRFDGTGEPVGAPISPGDQLLHQHTIGTENMALAGSSWAILARSDTVLALTGPLAGKTIELKGESEQELTGSQAWMIPADDEHVEVIFQARLRPEDQKTLGIPQDKRVSTREAPFLTRVNLKTGQASPYKILPGWFDDEWKPRLRRLQWVGRGKNEQVLFFGLQDGKAQLHRFAGRSWSEPTLVSDAPAYQGWVVSSWKDRVVLFDGDQSKAHWLLREQSSPIAQQLNLHRPPRNPGPWIPSASLALAEAVEPLPSTPKGLAEQCPASFATGPRRVVLLCREPQDARTPGLRAGTRVLRF
ncbi:MAG: hypothetical protein MUF64_04800, partial [Polyangiaceae bacterium]|nr:hypothetical protein [Polyangiaceae bacterium]